MTIFSKLIYKFSAVPIKIPVVIFFMEIDKLTLKFICKHNVPKIAKTILKKQIKVGEFTVYISKPTTNLQLS